MTIMQRQADAGNWQARGQEFAVGQTVRLVNGGTTDEGRVVAVYPGIGMIDVQFPHTSTRLPVEDVHLINPGDDSFVAPMHETVPGGAGSISYVSEGAPQANIINTEVPRIENVRTVEDPIKMASRVAGAYVKKSLYWHAKDRKYRCSRKEDTGTYACPKRACGTEMRPAVYKRENGSSVKLYACPQCMFLIRADDIISEHLREEM
jgi:hypothetical protein